MAVQCQRVSFRQASLHDISRVSIDSGRNDDEACLSLARVTGQKTDAAVSAHTTAVRVRLSAVLLSPHHAVPYPCGQ